MESSEKQQITKNRYHWLQSQLQNWLSQSIISDEQAQQIQAGYQFDNELDGASSNAWTTGILVALGAVLIGGGIIMLFAHNWEHLGKGARTFLSFLPLVLAQALCIYSFKKRFQSASWREASATLTFMAIAASIALIGQTYHIYGDLERFVLTWFVLGVPLAYLMRSNAVMVLATILVVWLCTFQGKPYWLLLITLIPLWVYFYNNQRSGGFYWSSWLATAGFAIALMISATFRHTPLSFYPITSLLLMASAFYGLGKKLFGFDNHSFWKNPLSSLGAIGIGIFSIVLSHNESWAWWGSSWHRIEISGFADYLDLLLVFIAIGIIVWLLISHWKKFKLYQRLLLMVGLMSVFAILHFAQWFSSFGVLVLIIGMNLFVLLTATLIIVRAVEQNRALLLNAGLLWLSSLILMRFFDSDVSILIKGFAFILIGCGFIGMNIWFNRQRKKSPLIAKEGAYD